MRRAARTDRSRSPKGCAAPAQRSRACASPARDAPRTVHPPTKPRQPPCSARHQPRRKGQRAQPTTAIRPGQGPVRPPGVALPSGSRARAGRCAPRARRRRARKRVPCAQRNFRSQRCQYRRTRAAALRGFAAGTGCEGHPKRQTAARAHRHRGLATAREPKRQTAPARSDRQP